jgi:hypothetical protein
VKVNGMTKLGSAATLALLLLTAGSAQAQLLFGSRLGQAHYEGDDMLRNASDGESRPWSNPQTGNSGTIKVLRSYTRGQMPCRDTQVNSQLKDRNVVYVLPVCQIADGSWKFAPQ